MNADVDPAFANVFGASIQWMQGTVLGSVATAVAVVAVASIGFLMLSGRVDVRRAAQSILGCFIIFGASTIAAGIVRVVQDDNAVSETVVSPSPPPAYPPPAKRRSPVASPYDPYAGAALPNL